MFDAFVDFERDGVVLFTGTKKEKGELLRLANRIGFIVPTYYGCQVFQNQIFINLIIGVRCLLKLRGTVENIG